MKIALIIVSYNSYDDIVELLDTIYQQQRQSDTIIIVDNASPNGDGRKLEKLAKKEKFEYIQAEKNGGFAYACNIGIRKAKELGMTHVGLINPDATLPDRAYLSKIEKTFSTTTYQMLGTYVVNKSTQKVEFGGADLGHYTLYPTIRHRDVLYESIVRSDLVADTDYATGSSLFFSLALFDDVGILDESYFMYFEETDYCMRVRRNGYRIGILAHTHIDHATSSSVGRMSAFYVRCMIVNFARFAWHHVRWYQVPGFMLIYFGFWVPGFIFKYLLVNIGRKFQL